MNTALNLAQFVLILMALVLVHEWGHMAVARWCGMRVERFSIFFGRPIASFQRGETQYAIGWLPLGGYVKITGMTTFEEVPEDVRHRTYHAAATWKRIATIAAGPGINAVVAVLAFAAMYWVGVPTTKITPDVAAVTAESPAARIGIAPGDTLVAAAGVRSDDPVALRAALQGRPGENVSVTYRHAGRDITRTVTLERALDPETGRPVGRLGFVFRTVNGPVVRYGPVEGATKAVSATWFVTTETGRILARQLTQPDIDQIGSVVGAGAVYNEVADEGLSTILRFIGLLSLALCIFNLLPIPPLDGGHILFALIEKVKGGPLSRRAYEVASMAGFAAVAVLAIILIQNDITRIANGTLMP